MGFQDPKRRWIVGSSHRAPDFQTTHRAMSGMQACHEALASDIREIYEHRFMPLYGYGKVFAQVQRRST